MSGSIAGQDPAVGHEGVQLWHGREWAATRRRRLARSSWLQCPFAGASGERRGGQASLHGAQLFGTWGHLGVVPPRLHGPGDGGDVVAEDVVVAHEVAPSRTAPSCLSRGPRRQSASWPHARPALLIEVPGGHRSGLDRQLRVGSRTSRCWRSRCRPYANVTIESRSNLKTSEG